MKLLLLSNSTMKGEEYLSWPLSYLNNFLKNIKEVLFIPFAGVTISYNDYTSNLAKALAKTGTAVTGIHSVKNPFDAVVNAECIAVGGGNTFQLLSEMQKYNLVEPIRTAVLGGTPFIGWSAGSNVACPTIMTTNDMPIVMPKDFNSLNLIDFQINAHFTTKTIDGHGGESRATRIEEFLAMNPAKTVVGLPEGKLLEIDGTACYLKGIETEPTYLFKHGDAPKILQEGKINIRVQ